MLQQRSIQFFSTFLISLNLLSIVQSLENKLLEMNEFGYCLMELQLPELLRLKHSMLKLSTIQNENAAISSGQSEQSEQLANCESPKAMALVAEERGYAAPAHGDYHQSWQPEEKPSKLQTLFQVSITALAFLSFGGYLLCLIVQAIKSKGTTYYHPVATATTTNGNGGVKRIKIYRRSRRWTQAAAAAAANTDYSMTSAYSAHYNYTATATYNNPYQL